MHQPVLLKEVIEYLNPKSNENFIDSTVGEMGHSMAILEKNKPEGKVLGIEWDSEIIKKDKARILISNLQKRIILVNDSFVNLKKIVAEKRNLKPFSGILFDLGLSSWHLEKSGRGFTFLKNEPLDMRYNKRKSAGELTAEKILNDWSPLEIENILKKYAQERFAKRISQEIERVRRKRRIKTTFQLVEIIKKATPSWYHKRKIHLATKTFQSLRIAVNNELDNLEKVLPDALEVLSAGGRLLVISFHSLEDRIVKNFFRKNSGSKIKILTRKPIRPSFEEIKINPRSRSAMLRAAIKL